ncbi:MAG: emopamil-binding family protein [Asgard group archaeon]|nr:emopamil-binding family protein [Asgard group archaeon]
MSETIPFKKRTRAQKVMDIIIIVFFIFNFIFITYMFDLEQIIILDTSNFSYPIWPPKFIVDLGHWFGENFDPALLARPAWWRATIWIDVLFFGPFYAVGTYAFITGKNWIKIPSVIWGSVMLTNVTIILFTEFVEYSNPYWWVVLLANLSWILFPILVILRVSLPPQPFFVREESEVPKAE